MKVGDIWVHSNGVVFICLNTDDTDIACGLIYEPMMGFSTAAVPQPTNEWTPLTWHEFVSILPIR